MDLEPAPSISDTGRMFGYGHVPDELVQRFLHLLLQRTLVRSLRIGISDSISNLLYQINKIMQNRYIWDAILLPNAKNTSGTISLKILSKNNSQNKRIFQKERYIFRFIIVPRMHPILYKSKPDQ
jgi:hypothetical protein